MQLATFSMSGGPAVGLVDGETVLELASVNGHAITSMKDCIRLWDDFPDTGCRSYIVNARHALSEVTLHAPIASPGKIMAIGLNYGDHAREAGLEPPTEQFWFTKPTTAVSDPFGNVELPIVSDQLDYEAELVVVIGKRCRHVPRDRAHDVIFGYAVGNDLSVRDWQRKTNQVTIGKSFDTHAPFGPWITTVDSVDPTSLSISSRVNGEIRQSSKTSEMIFDCGALIEELSTAMTLEPGDVIFTGTPPGVGAAKNPPVFLTEGDVVEVEIENLGSIRNTVIREVVGRT